jgi:NADPH-ferrihemoprotein reductase
MKFAVFGLGDTSYEQYNAMGKYFNEAFEELGGERIFKYGEGNAEGNKTEDDFNEWKSNFWRDIFDFYHKNETVQEIQISLARRISQEYMHDTTESNTHVEIDYPLKV